MFHFMWDIIYVVSTNNIPCTYPFHSYNELCIHTRVSKLHLTYKHPLFIFIHFNIFFNLWHVLDIVVFSSARQIEFLRICFKTFCIYKYIIQKWNIFRNEMRTFSFNIIMFYCIEPWRRFQFFYFCFYRR